MRGRASLAGAMLIAGLALAAVGLASGARDQAGLKNGGIFNVGMVGASVSIDPQVAYVSTAWWLEDATGATLYRFEGKQLVPEVAERFAVSRDGRTYTFRLRRGLRFSDGTPVTAASFRYAFERIRSPSLNSPARALVQDIRSVAANGNRLVVRLNSRDGDLVSRLTLPFFQATSTKLPLSTEVTSSYPSAGPYFFSRNSVDVFTSLRRNAYWRPGLGRRRPHLAGVDVQWNLNEQTGFRDVLANQLDLGPLPVEAVRQVAQRFGVNKSRFWVKPTSCVALSMFNNARGIFAGNGALRKAVNWALDRQKLAQEASPYAVRPWTHILSPVMPGAITAKGLQPYGVRANLAKARKIARGHLRNGRIVIAFSGSVSRVRLAVDALVGLGFDRDEIVLRSVPTTEIYDVIGRPGADWDFATGSIGWCTDFPDGASALAGLSRSFPANAKYERQLAAAQQLSGGKRYRAFGKLDVQIMRELAPVAPLWVWNNRYLFSSRVDPRSLVYEPALQNWSITALALD